MNRVRECRVRFSGRGLLRLSRVAHFGDVREAPQDWEGLEESGPAVGGGCCAWGGGGSPRLGAGRGPGPQAPRAAVVVVHVPCRGVTGKRRVTLPGSSRCRFI